jgi:hypothetical protein
MLELLQRVFGETAFSRFVMAENVAHYGVAIP